MNEWPFSMHNVLSIRDLRKAYGDKIAVDRISFEVSRGEIVGLLGPNGAGKTTTISMILGVLQPDSGSIFLSRRLQDGKRLWHESLSKLRGQLEEPGAFPHVGPAEFLGVSTIGNWLRSVCSAPRSLHRLGWLR